MNERTLPQNVNELRGRVCKALGIDESGPKLSTRTLERWAKQGLIPEPHPRRGKGRGKGSISEWPEQAICAAAGVWMLRSGLGLHWSRRVMDWRTIKEVQKCAAKVSTHPTVILSIPDDTRDGHDPLIEEVILSVAVNCRPSLDRFIIPYVITTEKVRRGLTNDQPAVVTFNWSGSATTVNRSSAASTRELLGVSVALAQNGNDELRFVVGGEDVREWMQAARAMYRTLRKELPPFFMRLRLLMLRLRYENPRFFGALRSLLSGFRENDARFYKKLRRLLLTIRNNEADPQFYDKLNTLLDMIVKSDPKFYEKLMMLLATISKSDPQFVDMLKLQPPTQIVRPLATEPIRIRDEDDTYLKVYRRYKGIKDEEGDGRSHKRHTGRGLRTLPEVPLSEFEIRLAFAYEKEIRNRAPQTKDSDGECNDGTGKTR